MGTEAHNVQYPRNEDAAVYCASTIVEYLPPYILQVQLQQEDNRGRTQQDTLIKCDILLVQAGNDAQVRF